MTILDNQDDENEEDESREIIADESWDALTLQVDVTRAQWVQKGFEPRGFSERSESRRRTNAKRLKQSADAPGQKSLLDMYVQAYVLM